MHKQDSRFAKSKDLNIRIDWAAGYIAGWTNANLDRPKQIRSKNAAAWCAGAAAGYRDRKIGQEHRVKKEYQGLGFLYAGRAARAAGLCATECFFALPWQRKAWLRGWSTGEDPCLDFQEQEETNDE